MTLVRALLAMAACVVATSATAARGDAPFVVTYRCDGGRNLVVAYPAYRDAQREPIRISWQGRTVLLSPTRVGSGARYINAMANLEWWSKGVGGFLNDLRTNRPLLQNCVEVK